MHSKPNHLYTTREAADQLRLTESMLAHWRQQGKGPEYVRIGHHTVRYSSLALEKFISAHSVATNEAR